MTNIYKAYEVWLKEKSQVTFTLLNGKELTGTVTHLGDAHLELVTVDKGKEIIHYVPLSNVLLTSEEIKHAKHLPATKRHAKHQEG